MMYLKLGLLIGCLLASSQLVLGEAPLLAQAQSADPAAVQSISNFLISLIRVLTTFAGLIATGFFVVGGLHYITSSGNPIALERAKRTVVFAAFGMVVAMAAFSLSGLFGDLAQKAFGV